MPFPARYVNLDEARRTFGDRVDRVGRFLQQGDPLADAAVEALGALGNDSAWDVVARATESGIASVSAAPAAVRDFFAEVERIPAWVDWGTLDRGCEVLLRAGALGGLVLGAKSLVYGYASPAGNKPLVLSGRLAQQAPRRLQETARFVQAVCRRGGLLPLADGYRISVRVRLMHAKVRQMIGRSGRWNAAWGTPINQHDMAATSMLFSWVVLEGLTQLGITIEPHEADDYMQLWRYVSHLLGVDPEVSPTSASEARRLGNLIMATQEPPDDDSRALTRALMDAGLSEARSAAERTSAERRRHFAHAVCRELTGDSLADGLAIERTGWRTAVFALKRVVRTTEKVRTSLRRANTRAILSGERYWDRVVSIGLEGATAEFRLPDRLLSA